MATTKGNPGHVSTGAPAAFACMYACMRHCYDGYSRPEEVGQV